MLMRTPLVRDRRRPAGFIPPCQPVVAEKVPPGDGWINELKHDGFRIVARKAGESVRLWSRNGRVIACIPALLYACRMDQEETARRKLLDTAFTLARSGHHAAWIGRSFGCILRAPASASRSI
jgi:hypothetical protein